MIQRAGVMSGEAYGYFAGGHTRSVSFCTAMPAGIQIGIHDIFLPCDYPEAWLKRHYSEQYLLACWLLAGDKLQIELPVAYCSMQPDLRGLLRPLIEAPNLRGAVIDGGAFWISPRPLLLSGP